ncbi:MAG: DNA starvation/stationary phase protection protein [Bryobacteraceae bacterium]|nr:DNA starvation/stationary phase protection protein [Bryobacteraceae bacterium]
MEPLDNGLEEQNLQGIVDSLNKLLADEHVLYVKTRNYHWNVTGPRFHPLHVFFEEQYDELAEIIDEVAENVRQFGGFACGTMAEFTSLARLKEEPGNLPDEDGMIASLVEDHEAVIRQLRDDIEQADGEFEAADAADFLTAVLEKHNKMAWMLRSHLTGKPGGGDVNGGSPDKGGRKVRK